MNPRFYRGNEIPGQATKDQTKAYRAYIDETKVEREAGMSFEEWVLAGSLSLAQLKRKWHEDHVAEMKARYGDNWQPEAEEAAGPRSSRSKVPSPSRGATKRVWVIADAVIADPSNDFLPDSKEFRAEVIKRCIAADINKGTAQVQFGAWKKARTA